MSDLLLGQIMDDLRLCVCAALADTLGGTTECACVLMPGQNVPANWCTCNGRGESCGMTWVRLDRVYSASQAFPAQDNKPINCARVLAAVLEVGVYRCQPVAQGNGQAPVPADLVQAALVQSDDALAMAKAITCCDAIASRSYVLNTYTPRDGGGCGGGAWTVTVKLTR